AEPPAARRRLRRPGDVRILTRAATDGGAVRNGEPNCRAGYGVHFIDATHADIAARCWGPESNNRGEITAVWDLLRATTAIRSDVELVTDSQVVINNLARLNVLVESDFADVDHSDLWRDIAREIFENERVVAARHVRSHTEADDPDSRANAAADALAT